MTDNNVKNYIQVRVSEDYNRLTERKFLEICLQEIRKKRSQKVLTSDFSGGNIAKRLERNPRHGP